MDGKKSLLQIEAERPLLRKPDVIRRNNSGLRPVVLSTFVIGNCLTLIPTSITKSHPWILRSLATSVLIAFVSAFTASLMSQWKMRRVANLFRYASIGFTALMVVLLCYSALFLSLARKKID